MKWTCEIGTSNFNVPLTEEDTIDKKKLAYEIVSSAAKFLGLKNKEIKKFYNSNAREIRPEKLSESKRAQVQPTDVVPVARTASL